MALDAAVSLEALRARIRELEGTPAQSQRVRSGVLELDEVAEGLPRPGLVELHGPPGSGRTRLALALLAYVTRAGQPAAWVDLDATLYPPAAAALDVALQRLLIVRPSADRATWAAEQLLRCGCFPIVVVSGSCRLGHAGHRWMHAAEAGGSTGLVIAEHATRGVPATVRLAVGGGELVVVRNRNGRAGRSASLPAWSDRANPWA